MQNDFKMPGDHRQATTGNTRLCFAPPSQVRRQQSVLYPLQPPAGTETIVKKQYPVFGKINAGSGGRFLFFLQCLFLYFSNLYYILVVVEEAVFVNNIFGVFIIKDLNMFNPDHNYVFKLFSEVDNFFYLLLLTGL